MSQCVPSWVDIDEPPPKPNLLRQGHTGKYQEQPHQPSSGAPLVPLTDYEVTELTWQNGQLALHGIGHHSRIPKPILKYPTAASAAAAANAAWSKHQLPSETLEAVVNQATGSNLFTAGAPLGPTSSHHHPGLNEWLGGKHIAAASAQATAVDALVPCRDDSAGGNREAEPHAAGMMVSGGRKRARGWGVCSSQGSAAAPAPLARRRAESTMVTLDSCGVTDDFGLTTTTATNSISPDEFGEASPETENTSFGYESNIHSIRSQPKHDEVCGEDVKARKKNRAAAIHNQSERKRRDRINEKMKTLQKLVPNSSKTDKASILDEVIDYMKQLQTQVQMIGRMSSMMLPMPMPQLQMSMMANMAQMAQMAQMGMGIFDTTTGSVVRPAPYTSHVAPGLLHPSPFIPPLNPAAPWEVANSGGGAAEQQIQKQPTGAGISSSTTILPDYPLSAFMGYQNTQQPMTLDAYNRMSALFQQFYQQQQTANPKG